MLKKLLMIFLAASLHLLGNMDFTIPDSWGKSAQGMDFEQGIVSLPGRCDVVSNSFRFSLTGPLVNHGICAGSTGALKVRCNLHTGSYEAAIGTVV